MDSGGDNILVGQGCFASMSAGPATLSDFHWSVSGDTFASFDMATDQSWGHPTPIDASEWSKPNPYWFWHKDDTATISCTATASVDGSPIGTVSATKIVTVWTPYHDAFPATYGCSYTADDGTVDSVKSGPPGGDGIDINCAVGTPYLFSDYGYGSCFYVQLTSINHIVMYNSFPTYTITDGFCLDNGWPYSGTQSADSTADRRDPFDFVDGPIVGILGASNFSVDEQFKTYLMYQPPDAGEGTQPVTLHRVEWKWNATGSFTSAGVGLGSWSPDPPGDTTITFSGWDTAHPSWEHIFTNSGPGQ